MKKESGNEINQGRQGVSFIDSPAVSAHALECGADIPVCGLWRLSSRQFFEHSRKPAAANSMPVLPFPRRNPLISGVFWRFLSDLR